MKILSFGHFWYSHICVHTWSTTGRASRARPITSLIQIKFKFGTNSRFPGRDFGMWPKMSQLSSGVNWLGDFFQVPKRLRIFGLSSTYFFLKLLETMKRTRQVKAGFKDWAWWLWLEWLIKFTKFWGVFSQSVLAWQSDRKNPTLYYWLSNC